MEESYRLHEIPETSLAFGLGVPYLALAGAVACWQENILKVRDGFGKLHLRKLTDDYFSKKHDVTF
jgi:hypothetical protein